MPDEALLVRLIASDAVGEVLTTQRTEVERNEDALRATDSLRKSIAAY